MCLHIDSVLNVESTSKHPAVSNENQSLSADNECEPPLLSPMIETVTPSTESRDPPVLSPEIPVNSTEIETLGPDGGLKSCLRVDGNTFTFSGSNCTIYIHFQSAK